MRLSIALFCIFAVCAAGQNESELHRLFDSVAMLIEQDEASPLEIAQASVDAARLLSFGPAGLPAAEHRFRNASRLGEAAAAGAYLTAWGGSKELALIKKELETNPRKRRWLKDIVGDEHAIRLHLESGNQYRPLLRLLPDPTGARALSMLLLRSHDPLVRRTGIFWGYWLADSNYWRVIRHHEAKERDPTTLFLIQQALGRNAPSAQ